MDFRISIVMIKLRGKRQGEREREMREQLPLFYNANYCNYGKYLIYVFIKQNKSKEREEKGEGETARWQILMCYRFAET